MTSSPHTVCLPTITEENVADSQATISFPRLSRKCGLQSQNIVVEIQVCHLPSIRLPLLASYKEKLEVTSTSPLLPGLGYMLNLLQL